VSWQHCLSDRLGIEILAHGLRTTSALLEEKRKQENKEKRKRRDKNRTRK
jgi:hypothetical protein